MACANLELSIECVLLESIDFVDFQLLKARVEMCLGTMAVTSQETDFTWFTSEWFHKVNRRGLFPVSDGTFTFIVTVEKVARQHLPCQYSSKISRNW